MSRDMTSSASAPESRHDSLSTWLLLCGVVAGPLFMLIAAIQIFTREGFDVTRHALSLLSVGNRGWVQIANFVVAGLLFLACAIGLRYVLHRDRGGTWGPVLIGAFGLGLIGGGVFVADPAFGFPPGTPPGMPDELTWHGILHGVAAGIGFLSLIAACFVFARRFAALGDRRWMFASVAVGLLFFGASLGSAVAPGQSLVNIALFVALVAGLGWVSALSARLRAENGR